MSELQSLAQSLGLKVQSESFAGSVLKGTIEGRAFWINVSNEGSTQISCTIDPCLDLGLLVSGRMFGTAGAGSDLFTTRVVVNDSDWDDELSSTADEPKRGRIFLTKALRKAIIQLNIQAPFFVLKDLSLTAPHPFDGGPVKTTVDLFVKIADLIDEARKETPAAQSLKNHAKVCKQLAQDRGLVFEETPFRLRGNHEEKAIDLLFFRMGNQKFRFFLTVQSKTMRPFGLHLRKQTLVDGIKKIFGAEDIEVGNAVFDKAFLIQAKEPERAKDALDEATQQALLSFAKRFDTVTLNDDGLRLEARLDQIGAGALEEVLGTAEETMNQIARASLRETQGPYR